MLYTVWVGGTEVNDDYFDNIHEARLLARSYVSKGYTDVYVEAMKCFGGNYSKQTLGCN